MVKKKLSIYRFIKWLCIGVAFSLVIASLFIPPYWYVDSSVWRAASLLFMFSSLNDFLDNVIKGKPATFSTGWSITFKTKKKNNKEKDQKQ